MWVVLVTNIFHTTEASATDTRTIKRVLNAGSGVQSNRQLHRIFVGEDWQKIRLDIDPDFKPDIVSSITNMGANVPSGTFDAVWCSHTLEHLYTHEVPFAISEFRRILKPDGFLLIRSPDLEAVASLIVEYGIDHVAYKSPAGPIAPLDMLFGHTASIERGSSNMSHKTGFTCDRLGRLLTEAKFSSIFVKREGLELWALALMQKSNQSEILDDLHDTGLDLKPNSESTRL